jgi:hypothetical protein
MLHSGTKHIEVRYHFPRDNVEKGNIDPCWWKSGPKVDADTTAP